MKILKAIIQNYKAIHRVEITPKGNITIISGANSEGKSSLIEALTTTIAKKDKGKDALVRKGSDGAIIEIDLGDRVIKRNIKGDKDELEVYTKEGYVVKRPRSILDELTDGRKFDVMTFITGSPKEQRNLLMELAGLSFDKLDGDKNVVYNDRTLVGRERDSLKGQLDGMKYNADALVSLVNTQELLEEIKVINKHNSEIKSSLMSLNAQKEKCDNIKLEISQVQERLLLLKGQYKDADTILSKMEWANKDLKEKETFDLETKLSGAEEANEKFRQNQKRAEVEEKLYAKTDEFTKKTEELKKIEDDKVDQLKHAIFPIKGLSLTDDGVLYNDLPLENESRSNKLKVAISIAIAIPTELRTIILDDAEVLDDENMKIVDDMMVKNDYQAIIARRQEPDDNTYTIKEGKVI